MENVIIETPKEYDLRSKKNQETLKTKTFDNFAKNNTVNKPKTVKPKEKIVVVNSDQNKEKGTQPDEK